MDNRDEEKQAFEQAVTRVVAKRLEASRATYVADENVLHYHHGDQWSYGSGDEPDGEPGTFAPHSAEMSLPTRRIVDHDVSVLAEFVNTKSEQLHGQLARSVFGMVQETSEASGNVVAIAGGSDDDIASAMKAMAERMELGVTRYGSPSYPSMFVHPSNRRMIDFVRKPVTSQLAEEMDVINVRKETHAVSAEALRLKKFAR
jgi:hypothetical protein